MVDILKIKNKCIMYLWSWKIKANMAKVTEYVAGH